MSLGALIDTTVVSSRAVVGANCQSTYMEKLFSIMVNDNLSLESLSEDSNSPTAKVVKKGLFDALEKMFGEEISTDITIVANGEEIKAFSGFLIASSPVFASMFTSDFKEKADKVVTLPEDADVVRSMIKFLYTTKISNMHTVAPRLLIASDKYQIAHLKYLCENHIIKAISATKCMDVLSLGQAANSATVKNTAIQFITSNHAAVLKTEGWKTFGDAELVKECFQALADCTNESTAPKRLRLNE